LAGTNYLYLRLTRSSFVTYSSVNAPSVGCTTRRLKTRQEEEKYAQQEMAVSTNQCSRADYAPGDQHNGNAWNAPCLGIICYCGRKDASPLRAFSKYYACPGSDRTCAFAPGEGMVGKRL